MGALAGSGSLATRSVSLGSPLRKVLFTRATQRSRCDRRMQTERSRAAEPKTYRASLLHIVPTSVPPRVGPEERAALVE